MFFKGFGSHSKLVMSKDEFVSSLYEFLRWSGHTMPHAALHERFPIKSEVAKFGDIVKACAQLGLQVLYFKKSDIQLTNENLPLLAIFSDGSARVCKGLSNDGAVVFSGGDSDDGNRHDLSTVLGFIKVRIDSRKLHEEIFGAAGASANWFWKPFMSNWWAYLQGAVAAAFINVLSVVAALYAMQVYNRVLPSKSTSTLMVLTTGVLLVYVIDFILKTLRAYVLDYAGKRVDLDLSEAVFVQGVGVRMESRPQHVGTFISQLREHESIRDFLMSTAIFVLSDLPFLAIFLMVMWIIGGQIVYIPLVVIPVVIVLTALLQWPMSRYSMEHVREKNARSGLLIEAVEGAETLKTLNAEWRMKRRWRELTEISSSTNIKVKSLTNLSANIAATAQQVMFVAIIAYGAILVQDGKLTAGALMACSILAGRALAPVSQLVGIITKVHHVRASAKVLDKIMALPVDRPLNVGFLNLEHFLGKINLVSTEFAYSGTDLPVLRVNSLEIKAGEKVAILGRTGSGKSTLLRLLSGLYMPTRGRVLLDDVDIHHVDPIKLRRVMGYMTQDVRLFAGTLKENLLLGAGPVDDDKLLEISRVTGIDRFVGAHPKGFDLPVYEGGGGMSGGQRQAIGLARLMLSEPKVYLLDEPTASMDQQTEREFIARFSDYVNDKRTLVVVTHKPSILALVDRIVILEQGQVVLDGPRDDVLRKLSALPTT